MTARLAAAPGHLSYVLSLSTETRADIALLSVVQSLRVLTLTLLVPLVAALLGFVLLRMDGYGTVSLTAVFLLVCLYLAAGLREAVFEYAPLMATTLARGASLPSPVRQELARVAQKLGDSALGRSLA